jgi:hypothetical protein
VVFLDGKTSSAVVSFLKSQAFKDGIRLVRNFNPVFAAAAHYLSSLTEALLALGKNRVFSQGTFGLHNYGGPLSAWATTSSPSYHQTSLSESVRGACAGTRRGSA